jgi:hypothetical protein
MACTWLVPPMYLALGGLAPPFSILHSAFCLPLGVALVWLWCRIGVALGVALGWLWGAYQLAINRLWGGSDVALMWLWGGFGWGRRMIWGGNTGELGQLPLPISSNSHWLFGPKRLKLGIILHISHNVCGLPVGSCFPAGGFTSTRGEERTDYVEARPIQ